MTIAAATSNLIAAVVLVGAIALLLVILRLLRARRRDREDGLHDEDVEPVRPTSEVSSVLERMLGDSANTPQRLTIPPRAGAAGRVPGPGVLDVAGVDLPAGRAVRHVDAAIVELGVSDGDEPVGTGNEQLWVASRPTPGAASRWKRLAAGFAQSGLWPLLLPDDPDADDDAWFAAAAKRHGADVAAVEQCFRDRLAESLGGGSPLASTDRLAATAVASGTLGRGSGRRTDALAATMALVQSPRLALAPGRRPADVLHALAWPGADDAGISTSELAELVASWEERYGALLVSIGARSMLLAILKPPANESEALEALAELHALCPDQAADWRDDVSGARQLLEATSWQLSWH